MKISKIKKLFDNIGFLQKVRLIYSVLVIIPILLLECFIVYSSNSFIREQQTLEVKDTITRNYNDICNQMQQTEKSLLYLTSNVTLHDFLETDDDEYIKRLTLSRQVGPLLYNSLLSTQNFSKIRVYSDKNFSVSNDLFKMADEEMKQSRWYQKVIESSNAYWAYEDDTFFIARRIVNEVTGKLLGVIRIDLKDNTFVKGIQIFSQIPVKMQLQELDKKADFFSYSNVDENFETIGYEQTYQLENSDWEISYQVSANYFSGLMHPRILASFAVVILILLCTWILIHYSTTRLLRRLYIIIEEVKKVKDENFSVSVDESSGDEIGELAASINRMLEKIRMLIDEIYKSKLEQKNMELSLLRSKINPHFLYNNLSAINWIAIEKGEDRIYEISTQLAAFYRSALNKGVDVDKLAIEMENIYAYIKLQMMAHEESFDVEYEVDETLLDVQIPIFIMQPIVENAIEHGVDTLDRERGKIVIQVYTSEKKLCIKISDNGHELYNKIGTAHLPREEFGYGVGNVDKRIKIFCGESYGVDISADSEGTISELSLRLENIVIPKN